MRQITITHTFTVDDDSIADQAIQDAADNLASVMFVQAEDGLYDDGGGRSGMGDFVSDLTYVAQTVVLAEAAPTHLLDNDGDWWIEREPGRYVPITSRRRPVGQYDLGPSLLLETLLLSWVSDAKTPCLAANSRCDFSGQPDERDGMLNGDPAYVRSCKHCGEASVRTSFRGER